MDFLLLFLGQDSYRPMTSVLQNLQVTLIRNVLHPLHPLYLPPVVFVEVDVNFFPAIVVVLK